MAQSAALERSAVYVLERYGERVWGFKPNLMSDFVGHNGPLRAVSWFAHNFPRYERVLKDWGPLRTHFICATISTLNGCRYCAEGHIRAFQLHYLQIYNRLFPIDDEIFFSLKVLEPADMIDSLVEVLVEANLSSETGPLRRAFELYMHPERAMGHKDDRMLHLIEMFETLSECGIAWQTERDEVHDPINRDKALQHRYQALRGA